MKMSDQEYRRGVLCPMCQFETPSLGLCLSHLRLVHGNDPRFCAPCGIQGCAYTGRSFSSLYSHIYRNHPEIIRRRGERPEVVTETESTETSEQEVQHLSSPDLQGKAVSTCKSCDHDLVCMLLPIHRSKG